MTIRRFPRGHVPDEYHRQPDPVVSEYSSPHEIEGSNFGENPTDADEVLPDVLGQLNPVPQPEAGSLLDRFPPITLGDGAIGRFVELPFSVSHISIQEKVTEILALRTEDGMNACFAVTMQQQEIPDSNPVNIPTWIVPAAAQARTNWGTRLYLEFGAGGASFKAQLDLVRGQTFTCRGSFLRLLGSNDTDQVVRVGAFVSLLPPSNPTPPTLTIMSSTILVDAALNVPIPAFAKTLRFYRTPASAPFTVRFVGNGGIILGEIDVGAGQDCPEIWIPPHATNMSVLCGAVEITSNYAVFRLSL